MNASWYQQQQEASNGASTTMGLAGQGSIGGQLMTQGPVRAGEGGIRAAWRELSTDSLSSSPQLSRTTNSRKKRKIKSKQQNNATPESPSLYRGKCPPEYPPEYPSPLRTDADADVPLMSTESPLLEADNEAGKSGKTQTLPRYYYYSENDDYGVARQLNNQQQSLTGRRHPQQQRHLHRTPRTLRSPT